MSQVEKERALNHLSDRDCEALLYDWEGMLARPQQLEPDGAWFVWLILTGRGWGKSRTGAEWIRTNVTRGTMRRIALVARTAADVRDVVIEGESGLLAISPRWDRPTWEPSRRRLTWPNGAIATTYSADEPDALRGPQHDGAWADELAAWRYPEAWDMLMLGLRLGENPRAIVTTTPRPTKIIKELIAATTTHVTRGTTYENLDNLAPVFRDQVLRRYEGTTMGRQEIEGQVLTDMPGALWRQGIIDLHRRKMECPIVRCVVGIDPAVTANDDSDDTGIIVAAKGQDGECYILDDLSCRVHPQEWATRAIRAYDMYRADRIVAEVNNGGEMVELTLRTIDNRVSYRAVHASRGKQTRAEPVAALYEQGRVHHVGVLADLEDQMCSWLPDGPSPDRIDALVWAVTDLMFGASSKLEFL